MSGAKGAIAYKKVAGSAKISVKAKTGKVKLAKGLKKGRYVLKIRVTAKATANYGPARKTVKTVINVK